MKSLVLANLAEIRDAQNMLHDTISNVTREEDNGATQREYDAHCRTMSSAWRYV